ncbi:helix-turn-helix domain-containing protein [Xenorhabdus sp. SF857]|uniref:helix-turn-helix transcriptional regulator n=1 Tax=Xenorhabdus bakwenae TaxID=3026967 RepID=UPI002557F8DD|nr:helix-turn-helix domain-containing protein [Xenorhabdus sp. SF857]WFQ80473.1 helix-turn-helix domain-containing protein [Xenorhabdus sp. SF857]
MDKLLNAKQVCKAMSISKPTLYRKIKSGQIPEPLKDGRYSKWKESDITHYINSLSRGFLAEPVKKKSTIDDFK